MANRGNILVADDEPALRLLLTKELQRAGWGVEVVSDGERALDLLREGAYHVMLLDIVMPKLDGISVLRAIRDESVDVEVIVLTGNASVESAIECMKLGAFEYIRKPYDLSELLIQIDRAMERRKSRLDIRILKQELTRSGYHSSIVGKSEKVRELERMIDRVAATQSTVLILGDSGTGKELVARSIHQRGLRKDKPFVAINCASFSETLLESELFGYEKGAFTDAKEQKRGLAEIADGGTLFLDEIGEIPMRFQAKLLRFLETGEIRRVGGTKDIGLNVHILCATNQPLERLIEKREFREDLYYRLNVLSITVPPLKSRIEDIPLLVNHFVKILGFNKLFDRTAMQALQSHAWPGNIRELKNFVERACIMTTAETITGADLSFLKLGVGENAPAQPPAPPPVTQTVSQPTATLASVERQYIVDVLKYVNGHKTKAASILDVNPKTLYNKMKAYNIVSVYE